MARLFTGIAVHVEAFGSHGPQLFAAVARAGMRCTAPENLHVTLQFLGAVAEEKIAPVVHALKSVDAPAFEVILGGKGWFPSTGEPKTVWVSADGGPSLVRLAGAIEEHLRELGFVREDRPFRPHVTIGRVDRTWLGNRNARAAFSNIPVDGKFHASEFHLYESVQKGDKRVYRVLATYPLQTPYT